MHEKDIGNPHFCIHLDTKTRIDLNLHPGINTFIPGKDIGLSKRVGVLFPYTYLVCGYKNTDRP
jgi:hypothetical protein